MDYFFITEKGVKKRDELEQAQDEAGNKELDEARARGATS
jgi:hypothetical protein